MKMTSAIGPCLSAARTIMVLVSALMLTSSVMATEAATGQVGVVVSNPPAQNSSAYRQLDEAAGRPEKEALEMTKSEMWLIAPTNWEAFSSLAARLSVAIRKLDHNWNQVLAPMDGAEPMTDAQKSMMERAMQSKAAVGMSMMALPDAALEEYALTKGMHGVAPTTEQPTLVIPLTADLAVKARRTSISKAAGGYAWHGSFEDTGEPVTLLWWPAGKMTGTATYKGRIYAIHSLGGGMHGVVQMDPNALPQDHSPMTGNAQPMVNVEVDPLVSKGDASAMKASREKGDSSAPQTGKSKPTDTRNLEDAAPGKLAFAVPNAGALTITPSSATKPDTPVTIRVLVAYTAAAAKSYAEIETDLIALAIEQANQSFRDSGIGNVQLELAHAYRTDYVENGTHFEHVFRFADKDDGILEEAHELRDRYEADVGILIVDDANGCGLAAEVFARPERAFAVVHHECAVTMYSLTHEIGHLIGARHDEALDDSIVPFAFGHGYVHGNAWRTMMGYKDSCGGCMRLPIWSTPAVRVRGEPAGDASSDNARVIAENAARVAGFR